MRFLNAFVVVLAGLVVGCGVASASDIYIAQNAVGAANGADCPDALPLSFFNTSSNWGSGAGQIGPGTTVHLCGTIANQITVRGGGNVGAPLILYFEPNAKISLPYCDNSNGCINISSVSYVTVDGGLNGIIENTSNGSGLAYQRSPVGILANTCSQCEIKHLTIQNLYKHTSPTDTFNFGVDGAIYMANAISPGKTLIHDNVFHDDPVGINYAYSANDAGLLIYNNTMYNVATGINLAGSTTGHSLQNAQIYGNHVYDLANWDTTGCAYHLNFLHTWAQGGATSNGVQIYNNQLDGNYGNCPTSVIFVEAASTGNTNYAIFNNVVLPTYGQMNNGIVSIGGGPGFRFYNNTVVGSTPGGYVCLFVTTPAGNPQQTGISLENNVISGCGTLVGVQSVTIDAWNYNAYSNTQASQPFYSVDGPSWRTWAQWQSFYGADSNSYFNSGDTLYMDVTGHPLSNSPVLNAGTNLVGLYSALNIDKAGMARPSSGAWDVGAYIYAQRPNPPTGLSVSVR